MEHNEKGATYLDKICHKLYDMPKGTGLQLDGLCRRCGGPLVSYYCEERLYLIVCEDCNTMVLTTACAPQVAANLTLVEKDRALHDMLVRAEVAECRADEADKLLTLAVKKLLPLTQGII